MSGHYHNPTSTSQNVGNSLGSRSCVRQSKLYRRYESGNGVKAALGVSHLAWDEDKKQGAYAGHAVWDAESERPTHSRPVNPKLRDVPPDPYHLDRHPRAPARAPLADHRHAGMSGYPAASAAPLSHFRDDQEPMAHHARRSHPIGVDAYDRGSDRARAMMEARRGSFGSHDAHVPPPAAYERAGFPDRAYERAGYPSAASRRETSHERVFGAPEVPRPAPRTYAHHGADSDATRSIPPGHGGYDAPPMYSRGENENISNLTGGVGRSSFDRDLEYAALNAKVSDIEKRMVLAAKTRPW